MPQRWEIVVERLTGNRAMVIHVVSTRRRDRARGSTAVRPVRGARQVVAEFGHSRA